MSENGSKFTHEEMQPLKIEYDEDLLMTEIAESFNKDTRIWQLKAERDALASMLKDVQKECIELCQENERLRAALRRVRAAIFENKNEALTDTLWMHDRLGETVVDCIDGALDDKDWEVRDRAALGEKE